MLGPVIDEHGGLDEVETGEAIFHWLAMPWKVFFAIVPPREKCGGWLAFGIALAQIGIVTYVVGEVANVLGCAVGLKTSVTAITFVALGTSLPDLFASASAARSSPYADSAVGNVTGSNAVNVFLGMGLPWMISSLYRHYTTGKPAPCPQGDLVFAVVVFLCCSAVCFFILFTRQYCLGGVLGGPAFSRNLSGFILICLWVIFVVLCSLNAYGVFGSKSEDSSLQTV
jgi:solute carrier family 8 (sodium/calcium exchanger)